MEATDLKAVLTKTNNQIEEIYSSFGAIVTLLLQYMETIEQLSTIEDKEQFEKCRRYVSTQRKALNGYRTFVGKEHSEYIELAGNVEFLNFSRQQAIDDEKCKAQTTRSAASKKTNKVQTANNKLKKEIAAINEIISEFSTFNKNLIASYIKYPLDDAPKVIIIEDVLNKSEELFETTNGSVRVFRKQVEEKITAKRNSLQKNLMNKIELIKFNPASSDTSTPRACYAPDSSHSTNITRTIDLFHNYAPLQSAKVQQLFGSSSTSSSATKRISSLTDGHDHPAKVVKKDIKTERT